MKTIFIFDDSRPTDDLRAVVALGEDGQRIARIKFDGFTHRHCMFAMCIEHTFCEDNTDISEPVIATRAAMVHRYDEVFGVANWMPLWLDEPRTNPDCAAALHRMRERNRHALTGANAGPISFGADALSGILGAIFGAPATTPHTTH
jgi:hypothetical protein